MENGLNFKFYLDIFFAELLEVACKHVEGVLLTIMCHNIAIYQVRKLFPASCVPTLEESTLQKRALSENAHSAQPITELCVIIWAES